MLLAIISIWANKTKKGTPMESVSVGRPRVWGQPANFGFVRMRKSGFGKFLGLLV